jgi:hypothetical protein
MNSIERVFGDIVSEPDSVEDANNTVIGSPLYFVLIVVHERLAHRSNNQVKISDPSHLTRLKRGKGSSCRCRHSLFHC